MPCAFFLRLRIIFPSDIWMRRRKRKVSAAKALMPIENYFR